MMPHAQPSAPEPSAPIVIGRYALYDEIASGGMATVHIGRLIGPVGFSRTVAIKRMHANLAKDPEFVSMFLDEARLAARIRHPNVIGTLDVVALAGELFLVMEYVHGESLFRLMKAAREAGAAIPLPIVSAIMVGVLDGLHAAHEATNEREEPLGIVHRDVSPHNVIIGASDGLARVLDFGIAKAADRTHSTRDGQIKGKLSYMAPEQLASEAVDRRSDIYAASVVLWEAIAGKRMLAGESELKSMVTKVLSSEVEPPGRHRANVQPELDALVLRGLSRQPDERMETAREMARALQRLVPPAPASDVAEWVERMAGSVIDARARQVAMIEQTTPTDAGRPSLPPTIPPPARRRNENATAPAAPAPPRRRVATFAALMGAALVFLGVGVGLTRAQGRRDVLGTAARPPSEDLRAPASAAPAPPAQGAAEATRDEGTLGGHGATAPQAAVSAPAPTSLPRPSSVPASPHAAPRKKASVEGEFDHVMDSRK